MPNLANNDVLLYSIRYLQLGQTYINTFHYKYTDNIAGADDYVAFSNAFLGVLEGGDNWIDSIQQLLHPSCTIVDHRMQLIYPNRLAPVVHALGTVGSAAGAALPTNTATVVTKRTINATRWGIGSWHQPGMTVSQLTSAGVVLESYREFLEGYISAFLGFDHTPPGMNGEIEATLWSKAVPLRFPLISSFEAQTTPRVMRRRTVGVGI